MKSVLISSPCSSACLRGEIMDKLHAQRMIRETFESPYEKGRFTTFVKNLLNQIEAAPFTYQGNYIPDAYKLFISSLERIGKYTDGAHKIDILTVQLKKETSLERARTMQRNFIAWYLNGSRGGELKDAALAAFVAPGEADWRFSLVKMDYRFEESPGGAIKVKEEFTPARRWSFLVGSNEASHTAQSRLVRMLADDEHNPTLQQLEEAFNIETVTREFFLKYRDLFIRVKEALDQFVASDAKVSADFESKGVDSVNFAKKLLGQIVFLYFLQKKGWFGVGRDAEWGRGSKHFLRELFEGKHGAFHNFFNDILEPLFYEALRIDRRHDDDYYRHFNCKIPFLNGGLFDPLNNYDWVHTDILLPNSLFSNQTKTKEGDPGDGILDVFDRYNFTVKEDEPLEKEVAIDPELLGKAYEKFNAIRPDNFEAYKTALKSGKKGDESKFNKQFGVYYTPREIVHYMCRQSLINYLATELEQVKLLESDRIRESSTQNSVSTEDLETLIHSGEQISEHEAHVRRKGRETETYAHKLPESIRQNAARIDRALANIAVCDPAVGSGAFPVGMMHEIVKAREVLAHFTQSGKTAYDFKRTCIEKSLYGVDIDPGAAEIAKLRLWLSLVVDEDDIRQIKPLPNLDYKIVCGNSLIGFPDNWNSPVVKELETLKQAFFSETNPTHKQALRAQIDAKIQARYHDSLKTFGYAVTFDFRTVFSEVFHTKGGFDVVMGNPPYVQIQKFDSLQKMQWEQQHYQTFNRMGDIYCLFYEKGVQLLKSSGSLCFITSNKWMRANYGVNLREFLANRTNPLNLIDFGSLPMFEATVDTNILMVRKNGMPQKLSVCRIDQDYAATYSLAEYVQQHSYPLGRLSKDVWVVGEKETFDLKRRIEEQSVPLNKWDIKINYGIKTGYNKAFIIDKATRDNLFEKDATNIELLKPVLMGKDIQKWKTEFSEQWVISTFPSLQLDIHQYPGIRDYLSAYRRRLEPKPKDFKGKWEGRKSGSYTWFETQDSIAYHQEFEKPKIIWGNLTLNAKFALDTERFYLAAPSNMLTCKNHQEPEESLAMLKYLLAILNSKVSSYYMQQIGYSRQGGYLEYKKIFVEQIPIKHISPAEQEPFIRLVDYILFLKQQPVTTSTEYLMPVFFEQIIDGLVYELYLPESVNKSKRAFANHLQHLPDLAAQSDKMRCVSDVFTELYHQDHPIRNSVFYIDSVPEIAMIEKAVKF